MIREPSNGSVVLTGRPFERQAWQRSYNHDVEGWFLAFAGPYGMEPMAWDDVCRLENVEVIYDTGLICHSCRSHL